VPVLPGDDEAALAARVLAQEHRLYPMALALAAGGTTAHPLAETVLANPLPPSPSLSKPHSSIA